MSSRRGKIVWPIFLESIVLMYFLQDSQTSIRTASSPSTNRYRWASGSSVLQKGQAMRKAFHRCPQREQINSLWPSVSASSERSGGAAQIGQIPFDHSARSTRSPRVAVASTRNGWILARPRNVRISRLRPSDDETSSVYRASERVISPKNRSISIFPLLVSFSTRSIPSWRVRVSPLVTRQRERKTLFAASRSMGISLP